MSLPDNYYLFGRKPLQYAVIDPVSCTGCGWCAMFCPVECMFQRPDGFYDLDVDKCIGWRSGSGGRLPAAPAGSTAFMTPSP